jgi:dihydroflavonol-4-reductase
MARDRPVALVTGATGFLGLNLVRELTGAGWDVVALHRHGSDLKHLRRFPVRLAESALEDPASLERATPEGLDAVFHTAADLSSWRGHRDRQTRTNVDGTRRMVELALRRKARKFVHTSTTGVYGLPREPFDESAPHLGLGSAFHYQHTKALAEAEVRAGVARGLDAVILNPANIIGAFDARSSWSRLIVLAATGKLPAVPPGGGSFCHGAAVARAHVAAVEKGRTGENYILGGADASYRDVVRTLGDVMGRELRARTVPGFLLRAAGRSMGLVSRFTGREPFVTPDAAAYLSANLVCRSDKAVRELGYAPATLRDMLEDSYRWLLAEGLLQ